MQTERVTFLTSRDHKAALDAFAASNGKSVGNVVREATTAYIAREPEDEYEGALELIVPELEMALAKWTKQLDLMEASIGMASNAIDRALAGDPE